MGGAKSSGWALWRGRGLVLGTSKPHPRARLRLRQLSITPRNLCARGGAISPGQLNERIARAGRKWAAAAGGGTELRRELAELEGSGERSSAGPRGPGERAAGGSTAAAAAAPPGERGGDGAPSRVGAGAGAGAGASAMFAGLQDLGVANGEDLKETLTNCTEPLKAIEQFQVCRPVEAGRFIPGRGTWETGLLTPGMGS